MNKNIWVIAAKSNASYSGGAIVLHGNEGEFRDADNNFGCLCTGIPAAAKLFREGKGENTHVGPNWTTTCFSDNGDTGIFIVELTA